jgi:hypothetical protein
VGRPVNVETLTELGDRLRAMRRAIDEAEGPDERESARARLYAYLDEINERQD